MSQEQSPTYEEILARAEHLAANGESARALRYLWRIILAGTLQASAFRLVFKIGGEIEDQSVSDMVYGRIMLIAPAINGLPYRQLYESKLYEPDAWYRDGLGRRAVVVDPSNPANWRIYLRTADFRRAALLQPSRTEFLFSYLTFWYRSATATPEHQATVRALLRWNAVQDPKQLGRVACQYFCIGDLERAADCFAELGDDAPIRDAMVFAYMYVTYSFLGGAFATRANQLREAISQGQTVPSQKSKILIPSAFYLVDHLRHPPGEAYSWHTRKMAARRATLDGAVCEFGVALGHSITQIAELFPNRTIHGFDSFEGLPEPFAQVGAGGYSTLGCLPSVPGTVKLHKGWFEDTLPDFVAELQGPIAYLHIDCDLYSSTKTVLDHLGPHIVSGTVIVFDEYLAFEGWEDHEYKAFQEFIAESGHTYSYIGFSRKLATVAVVID
jgi:hypothetical protein